MGILARLKGRKIGLTASIGLAFALAVIPILLFIASYGYRSNARSLYALTESHSDRSRRDAVAAVEALLAPVAGALRVTAELAAIQPGFFRSEGSRDYLHAALISAAQIDAIYASFEDGYHRVVTKVDDDRRRNDSQIPAAAWHSSYIDAFARGVKRTRHRTFFDVWPAVLKTYDVETTIDIRTLPQYEGAKASRGFFIAEPSINPDTGGPVISVGHPILAKSRFIGIAAANITFDIVARYLDAHRVSPHSVTLIIDAAGRVVAHPDLKKVVLKTEGKLVFADAASFPDANVRDAVRLRRERGADRVLYESETSEYIAACSC